MIYFAYGSNMSLPRLAHRIQVHECLGTHQLSGYQLKFHKQGDDGSAKCDAHFTGDANHNVIGVLFRINADDKDILDTIEGVGKGYECAQFILESHNEPAFFYIATDINHAVSPFCWYKHHVLYGAQQANLPPDYIKKIERVDAVTDGDEVRRLREMAIY